MTECNAIIEANNEIDELKRENKELNELCVKYGFKVGRLEEENKQLKQGLNDDLELIGQLQEENEQLKKHNTELINKIDFLERVVDGDV